MSAEGTVTGREYIAAAIHGAGVDTVFTVAGGHFLPTYNALAAAGHVRVVPARHEQGAGYMASGYALVTRRPGVVFSGAPGPGATNLVTAVANANADSIPLLVITGQVDGRYVHRNILQYCDNVSLFEPFTKSSRQAPSLEELPHMLASGLQLAASGRPAPVHIAVPQNFQAERPPHLPETVPPALGAAVRPAETDVDFVLDRLASSERPAILAGHGVVRADAASTLEALAERLGAPVATSRSGIGSIDTTQEAAVGMLGFYGTDAARAAMEGADLVLVIGCALGEQTTFGWRPGLFGQASLIQVDIDASQFNRAYPVQRGVVGDAGSFLRAIVDAVGPRAPWFKEPVEINGPANDPDRGLSAAEVLRTLNAHKDAATLVSADIGNHRLWVCEQLQVNRSEGLLQSCEFDAMGFSLPAAIGAAVAEPGTKVVAISGDGGVVHTLGELAVAKDLGADVVSVVFVDGALGILRHQAEEMYGTDDYVRLGAIDFEAVASAFGVKARTVREVSELEEAVHWAFATDGPILLAVAIDPAEVFPPLRTKIEQRRRDLLGE